MHDQNMIPWPKASIPYGWYMVDASDGGQGSFSYADTSVYGQRQIKGQYFEEVITYDYLGNKKTIYVPTAKLIVPGSGGGARLPGGRKFGSHATGFDPRGAVLLRLYK